MTDYTDYVGDSLSKIINRFEGDRYVVIDDENDILINIEDELNAHLALLKEKGLITQYIVDNVYTFENCGITTGAIFAAWTLADGYLNSISTEWRMT